MGKRIHRLFSILLILFLTGALTGGLLLHAKAPGSPLTQQRLSGLDLDGITRVMVVAHPDDETFWGGGHLARDRFLVVSLTGGDNPVRRQEFEKAVELAGGVPLMLEYPDKVMGIRSRWFGYRDDIRRDLEVLLGYRDWEMIATHNPDGEYGHIQHRMTSSLVTETVRKTQGRKLFYFGAYYTEKELEDRAARDDLPEMVSPEYYKLKQQMTEVYESQKKVAEEFGHMFPYEEWVPAE